MTKSTTSLVYHGVVLSKKNRHILSRQGGIIPDKKAQANEHDMVEQFMPQLRKQGGTKVFTQTRTERLLDAKAKNTRYFIKATFYHQNNRRRDLDNEMTSILDALTRSGAIVDDCRQFVKSLYVLDGGIDRDDPRAEIEILTVEDGIGQV